MFRTLKQSIMDSNLKEKNHYHSRHHGLVFSVILIIAGTIFLGINTGFLPTEYRPLFFSWPIWVVFAGLYFLLNGSFHNAFVFLTVGVFFLMPEIGQSNPALGIPVNFIHLWWPILLIIAGIYFALCRLFWHPCCHRHVHSRKWSNSEHWNSYNKYKSDDGYINVTSSFESRKNIVLDPVFKGGQVDCSFGEIIIDLRKTTLPEGKTKLSITVSFGSVIVIVPDRWNVDVRGESMFGNFNDNRLTHYFNPDDNHTLVIDGKCSFGECKLRD